MNREQAESLLAQLVFDDLEDAVRSELLAYLKTDAELNERLGDMRLTAKLLHDAVGAGEMPKLDEQHKVELQKRIEQDTRRQGLRRLMTSPIGSRSPGFRLAELAAVVAICALLVGILLPSLGAARRTAKSAVTMSDMRQLQTGMMAFAEENDGRYPESIGQLVEQGYVDPEVLITPFDEEVNIPGDFGSYSGEQKRRWADENTSYQMLALGEKMDEKSNPSEEVVGYYKIPDSDRYALAFGDGHVATHSEAEAKRYTNAITDPVQGIVDGYDQIATSRSVRVSTEQERLNLEHDTQQARVDEARRKLAMKGREAGSVTTDLYAVADGEGWVTNGDSPGVEQLAVVPDERFAQRQLGDAVSGSLRINLDGAEGLVYRLNEQVVPRGELLAKQAGLDGAGKDVALQSLGPQSGQSGATEYWFYGQQPESGGRLGYSGEMGGYGGGGAFGDDAFAESEVSELSGAVVLNQAVVELGQVEAGRDVILRGLEPAGTRNVSGLSRRPMLDELAAVASEPVPVSPPMAITPAATNAPEFSLTESLPNEETGRDYELFSYDTSDPDHSKLRSAEDTLASAGQEIISPAQAAEGVAAAIVDMVPVAGEPLDVDGEGLVALAQGYVNQATDKKEREADEETPVLVGGFVIPVPEDIEPARKPRLMPVNPWVMTGDDRLSTFALDVDTASYGIARRYIRDGFLPPRHTVRMEEFVNYFDYNYPAGQGGSEAFTVHAEAGASPFGEDTVLLKIGVRGKVVGRDQAKPAHLVFVVDTSGSMERDDRLPLVRQSLAMVLDQLSDNDRVTVVGYGTEARLLVEAASGGDKQSVLDAVETLQTGGSTNLLGGVALGYEVAQRHYITGGVNRVILCSDGVANVGPSEADELLDQAQSLRKQGVTFTSVGFGAGNYDDRVLEQLANKGDGGYLFVGSFDQAKRVFVDDLAATRPTIAFDAKIQVDFDPARVRRYRLIGYENRDIADTDFRNDTVDAGEVGSGQSATALYEVELLGPMITTGDEPDLGTVFIRYRDADTGRVREIESRLSNDRIARRSATSDARFYLAASAARFAEVLRGSEHVAESDMGRNLAQLQSVLETVAAQFPMDRSVQELLEMVRRAQGLPRTE